ncbi:MAG: dihydrolipoyl dehydrogenase, partial [Pseudomonadota bacterium]
MAEFDFDVVVIGAGPGGYVAAIRAAQHGLKVACVEKRDRLGGTCLNVGCIPSKALLHGSEFYEEAHSGALAKFGVKLGSVELDLPALLGEKDKAVKELTDGIAFLFKKNKVEWVKGEAKFTSAKSIQVGDRSITAKNFIIATGSEVALLPGMTPDGEVIVTSTEALALDKVPGHLVVIGGGYIGLEMGSVWRRLGAKVTVVEYAERIVPAMDVEVANAFAKVLKKQGFEIMTSTKVTSVVRNGAGATVTVEPAAGGTATEIVADVVLLSVGRRPNTDGLNIEATGIMLDRGRVMVNSDFSTAVPGLWAIGDVVPGPMLAHKAEDEGIACADNIAGLTGYVNHHVIPAVVYTSPEVATVGKTEEELK